MGDELGNATDIDRFVCVFRTLHQIPTIFGAVVRTLGTKRRQKLVCLSFLEYLGEIESYSQTVWTCRYTICARVSTSNFQVLVCNGLPGTRYDCKNLHPLSGWPSSCEADRFKSELHVSTHCFMF